MTPADTPPPTDPAFLPFDLLATLVAVVDLEGRVRFANAALEDALGASRRSIHGSRFALAFTDPRLLEGALQGAGRNDFAVLRYDAVLLRHGTEPMQVHVVVAQTERTGEVNWPDWEQKWQSSGQPPVLAERMPSTSTSGPHHPRRTSWARAASDGTEVSGT